MFQMLIQKEKKITPGYLLKEKQLGITLSYNKSYLYMMPVSNF